VSKTQRHRQEPDRRPCDKHITSRCRHQAPDVRKQRATCVAVRLCCAPSLSTHACSLPETTHRSSSIPRNWSMHISQQPGRPYHCRLTDPSSPSACANSMRCVRCCVHARALVLLGWMRYVCPARKHLPVALAWETRGALSHAAFSDLAPALTASSECHLSVAISRWADVRVTMLRGRALSWARLAHQQPLFMQRSGDLAPAQSRAASNSFVLAARA